MRKLLTLLFSFFAIHSFAQIPVQRTTTTTPIDNYLKVKNLLTLPNLGDTITFSGSNGLDSLGSIIYVKSGANKGLWLRDTLNGAHTWVKQQYTGASTISKLNDSALLICNSSSCDTIVVSIAAQPIQNWTVLSDTSIQVCGTNACDTVYTNPIYYGQTYVDSVTVGVGNTAVKDTVNWYKDGIKHQAGLLGKEIQTGLPLYVQYNSDSSTATIRILQADGIISGCQVTWSGTGFTYNISPCVAQINDSVYSAPQNTVTLPNPDPTYPTSYVFIIDTTATTGYIAGTPSPSAPVPQTQYYQLPLTSAITLNPGDTIPPNINYNKVIYDEGLGTSGGEWNTSSAGTITYDTLDISNPYHLSHDLYVNTYFYSDMYFTASSPQTYSGNGDVLTFHIYTNGNFKNKNNIYLAFANDTTNVTNFLLLSSSYGFNKNNGNIYQTISVPLSAFNWSATTYNRLTLVTTGSDNTGTAGYFLDYITLQSGTPNITPPTDYSNKVDSTTTVKVNDSTYVGLYWIKGISYQKGDTIHTHSSSASGSVQSVTGNPSGLVDNTDPTNPVVQQDALKLNISDTASMLSPYLRKIDTTGMRLQPIAGTNMTITGTYPNLTFNSTASGGSSTIDTTITATTNGQTNFVFASLPSRYLVFVNNMPFTNFTTSGGNTIIVGFTDIVAGDIIRLYQTQ